MNRQLTISIEESAYDGLYKIIGEENISRFLSDLAKPHVLPEEMKQAYIEMASDAGGEKAAEEWCENLLEDSYDETR